MPSSLPVYTIEQIAEYLRTGVAAGGSGGIYKQWQMAASGPTTITYNTTGLTAEVATLARAAFQLWDEVTGLSFVETSGTASMMLDDAAAGAYASSSYFYYNSNPNQYYIDSVNINIEPGWNGESNPGFNSYTFQTLIHEIGHAIGLGHGGPYNGSADHDTQIVYQNDTTQFSVMSYYFQNYYDGATSNLLATMGVADMHAAGLMYGAPADTRTGDTVYGHNATTSLYQGFDLYDFASYAAAPSFTIYDSAGTDTLDASGYGNAQTINLAAGSFSDIGGKNNNIAIALSAAVENARGGSGADTLDGNALANWLHGNGGGDTLNGEAGSDKLWGGEG